MKIETSGENPNKQSPVVGYFPTGYDPLKHRIEGGQQEAEAKVKVYRNVKRTNRIQLVVTPNESRVDFVGTNYSGEATGVQLCTYGLGILDKSTQTLKIVPVAANKIFRLEPRVRGLSLHENEEPHTETQELTAEEKTQKTRELDLKYSTKKSIQQARKRESLQNVGGPQTQQEMDQKMKSIKINKEALEVAATTATNARNIPPHNLDATTPETAYPLDKIIFKGEWDYLLDILQHSQAGEKVSSDVYPAFVCHRFHKLDDMEGEVSRRQLAGILSYITHLVKFKDRHSMDGVSSAKHHKIPSILFQKFSTMFAGSESKRLSDEKRDLLISYVLVLTLYVDDFRTDLSDIAKDLRMNPMSLRPHYQFLGCKLVNEKGKTLAMLPLPLQFQAERKRKRMRR